MKVKKLLFPLLIWGVLVVWVSVASALTLEGTSWRVTAVNNGQQAIQSILPDTTITALFKDGKLTGSAGCNNYWAAYKVSGQEIEIGIAASTRMFCSNPPGIMEQEKLFLEALRGVKSYRFSGKRLELLNAGGAMAATLEAEQEAAPGDEEETAAEEKTDSRLLIGQWLVKSIAGHELIPKSWISMDFAADGQLAGHATVNNYFAYWIAVDGSILIGGGGTTMMAGSPEFMEQEATFLHMLSRARRYSVRGNELTITTAEGTQIIARQTEN